MKETFIAISGLLLQIVVGFAPIFLFKAAIVSKSALGRLAGELNNRTKGITNKAKDFGEGRNFYQRRQMARDARSQERRRGNVEDYATAISRGGFRSNMLRRRAAGGMIGQAFNANQAGQQRIGQAADDILRKQRHEEATRALQRMNQMGVEGDDDLFDIATGSGQVDANGNFAQMRNGVATGVTMRVSDAERQAAINSLVSQGRVGRLRRLESTGPARGVGGTPNSENPLHHMLDEAYASVPNKLGDKAPDLMPNRRSTSGVAAFTNVSPGDVAGWHDSTVEASERFYHSSGDFGQQDVTLRAFAEATRNTSTLAKLDDKQVFAFRNMMKRRIAAGHAVDGTVQTAIEEAYRRKGGNDADPFAAAVPPAP